MERLYILDGSGYVYRAHYGIGSTRRGSGVRLTTAAGLPTGALYVFAQMLIRVYQDIKPQRIAVVFDAPGRTFRHELDERYKANRREMPEDLREQIPYFPELTRAFCWPVLTIAGVEADDVIATLVDKARARDWEVTIFSGDKDLTQLIDPHVTIYDAMRDITYDVAAVVDKFGVPPEKMCDYLALVGDTSDNVPGVPGVGGKTAAKLLSDYGSIDGILAHLGELKGKQRERFEDPNNLAELALSRKLVTLQRDVDLGLSLDELVQRPWDSTALAALFTRLEFHVLLNRLGASAAAEAVTAGLSTAASPEGSAESGSTSSAGAGENNDESGHRGAAPEVPEAAIALAGSMAALAALCAKARAHGRLAVHVQTDGLRPDRARTIGFALAAPEAAPVYVPLAHRYLGSPAQPAVRDLPAELLAVLADPGVAVLCHDAKNARRALASVGIALDGIRGDTMLAMYLLDPDRSLDLDRVVAAATGITLPPIETLLGKGKKKTAFESISVEAAARYTGAAAFGVLVAETELRRRISAAGLLSLMDDVEVPLAKLLADIEQIGICINTDYLRELSNRVSAQIAALEKRVFELSGYEINLGSPKQLSELLFDKLQLKSETMKKTTTGYSTDHEVLESLSEEHPVIEPIIEHRELLKLKGTYLDALPPLINPRTGRIHTSFQQAVAATGRLSSQDPNLQNIPIRTEVGREIRRAFVAAPGKTLVSVDYSQIELRILAHLSQDPVLVKAFREDIDVHSQTAAEVFELPLDKVGDSERRVAKAVNYGLVYGQSQFGLARQLRIERGEAKRYMTRYFERFATVKEFMEGLIAKARAKGYAETILGRKRPLPDIRAKNFQRRRAAERMAQNTPMQGSAADIMKLAMLRIAEKLSGWPHEASILLTVHDELIFEVAPAHAEELARVAAAEMEGAIQLSVPLQASIGIADNWADAH